MPLGLEKLSLKDKLNSDTYSNEKQENVAPPPGPPPPNDTLPSYTAIDPEVTDNEPTPAELNAAFSNLKLSEEPPSFPTSEHCLAHLKLLNVPERRYWI